MMLHAQPARAVVAAVFAVAVAACGSDEPAAEEASDPGRGDAATVVVSDMAYQPATLTVQAGTTVTWVFDDGAVSHDVAGDGFQSDIVDAGSFSHHFEEPGTYDYVCTLHPNMTGTVEVTG